jgi:hypothetical protein
MKRALIFLFLFASCQPEKPHEQRPTAPETQVEVGQIWYKKLGDPNNPFEKTETEARLVINTKDEYVQYISGTFKPEWQDKGTTLILQRVWREGSKGDTASMHVQTFLHNAQLASHNSPRIAADAMSR